jgi:hypothetical protein
MTISFKIPRATALAATALALGAGAFAATPAHAQTPVRALYSSQVPGPRLMRQVRHVDDRASCHLGCRI